MTVCRKCPPATSRRTPSLTARPSSACPGSAKDWTAAPSTRATPLQRSELVRPTVPRNKRSRNKRGSDLRWKRTLRLKKTSHDMESRGDHGFHHQQRGQLLPQIDSGRNRVSDCEPSRRI